jgi:hypothetical protein
LDLARASNQSRLETLKIKLKGLDLEGRSLLMRGQALQPGPFGFNSFDLALKLLPTNPSLTLAWLLQEIKCATSPQRTPVLWIYHVRYQKQKACCHCSNKGTPQPKQGPHNNLSQNLLDWQCFKTGPVKVPKDAGLS